MLAQEQERQAQAQQEPDAMMVAAQAEMQKAQADKEKIQADFQIDMMIQQNKQMELKIQMAKLEQEGYKISLSEQKQSSDIAKTRVDAIKTMTETQQISVGTVGQQIDNLQRVTPHANA